MNIKIYFAICFLSLFSWALSAQEGNVGIGTINPHNSALLDVSSENKGLLVPHVQLRAINDSTSPINRPADGLLVYHIGGNNIEKGFYYWDGDKWVGRYTGQTTTFGVQIVPDSVVICNGGSVKLQTIVAASSGTCLYTWRASQGTNPEGASPTVSPSVSTTYTVTVSNNGHTASAQAIVIVKPNPVVTLPAQIDAGCTPIFPTTLTACCTSDNSDLTYAWHASTGENLSGDSIIVTPSVSTTYTVTVTDSNGCIGTASTSVNVRNILGQITEFTVNGVSFNMVPVRGGEFLMGAQKTASNGPNYDADAADGSNSTTPEQPVHKVNLTDYAIGETEVTQALWLAVVGNWPGTAPSTTYGLGDTYPAYYVTWDNIMDENTGFLVKLNQALESERCGMHFALPTEAQWEYAAAGGQHGYNANGTRIHKFSGSNNVADVAWYYDNTYNSSSVSYTTQPVKGKAANELGLYDMSGNVYEWCNDWYGVYVGDVTTAVTNPTGPDTGDYRIIRGGGWYDKIEKNRVAHRHKLQSAYSYGVNVGFRLALVP